MSPRMRRALIVGSIAGAVGLGVSMALATTVTGNMGLTIPTPGQTPGPAWANIIDQDLQIIDAHSHVTSQGRQVPLAGIQFNSSINLLSGSTQAGVTPSGSPSDLLYPRTVRLYRQSSAFTPGGTDRAAVYALSNAGGTTAELVYVDGAGNVVPITNSGSVAGATGTISGLVSPASAAYATSGGTGTITFRTNSSGPKSANLDFGAALLRDTGTNGANAVTIKSPSGLASAYNFILPTGYPGSTLALTMSSTGQLATSTIGNSQIAAGAVTGGDNASGSIAKNTILGGPNGNIVIASITGDSGGNGTGNIVAGTITANNIASGTIVAGNIHSGTITNAQLTTMNTFLPTVATGWTNAATSYCYTDINNIVHMSGFQTYNGSTSGTSIVTLPAQCAPPAVSRVFLAATTTTACLSPICFILVQVSVNTDSTVTWIFKGSSSGFGITTLSNGDKVFLDGLTWLSDG